MKLSGFQDLYVNPILARVASQYVHPTGTQVAEIFGHGRFWTKFWPEILNICGPSVPGGYIYGTALRAMKGTYIGFQSIIVSILDHLFRYGVPRRFCWSLENSGF